MTLNRIRTAAWAVPLVCFAFSTALIVERNAAFVAAVRRSRHADLSLNQAYAESDALSRLAKNPRFAAAPRRVSEESAFFAGLRRHAALANVSIVRLRSQSSTFGDAQPSGGPASADPLSPDALKKGVTKVSCQLVLDGSFSDMRRFLRGLWKADRLYTFSDVAWSRAKSGTELTVTINRYVAPAPVKEASNS